MDPYRSRLPPFAAHETARRVSSYRWIELRLFEVLGQWVATVPEVEVKMALVRHSFEHAWHAELWHGRPPGGRGAGPDHAAPANAHVAAFVDAMVEPQARDQTVEKLVGVYRVLIPHKIAAYTYHRDNAARVSDGPTIRSLELVLHDEMEEWRDGEMLIQSLLAGEEHVRRAAAHQARLESLLHTAGGIAGAGSIGGSVRDGPGGAGSDGVGVEDHTGDETGDQTGDQTGPKRPDRTP